MQNGDLRTPDLTNLAELLSPGDNMHVIVNKHRHWSVVANLYVERAPFVMWAALLDIDDANFVRIDSQDNGVYACTGRANHDHGQWLSAPFRRDGFRI